MKNNKSIWVLLVALLCLFLLSSCGSKTADEKNSQNIEICSTIEDTSSLKAIEEGNFKAIKSKTVVEIDGCAKDQVWSNATWFSMNYVWMGEAVDKEDYSGRFKLAWDNEFLYVLVEVTDEYLHPTLQDGLENFWKGDYVEVFIDEDQSGGDHKFNHQAFAYHISTEGHAIDQSIYEKPIFLKNHVKVARSQEGNTHVWEMAIRLYDNSFNEEATNNKSVIITSEKKIGFSIAYGDNDGNKKRENFMGSKKYHGINNDEGYVNADVFGSILFVE